MVVSTGGDAVRPFFVLEGAITGGRRSPPAPANRAIGMPIRKHTSIVASRMKISMRVPFRIVDRDFPVLSKRVRRRAKENPLDDEEQKANPADLESASK